jgi:hypothetical protein
MNFEKMTVIQLRQYMKQHGIKPLSGRKADIIARIKEFQKIGIDSNSIYKNDLKSLYDNNIYTKMTTVKDLQKFMRENKIKGLNQKKELLIQTILDAGYDLPMVEKPRKLSKKEKKMKSYYTLDSKNTKREESIEQLLKKRKMVDLVNLLEKLGIRPKKIPRKKQDLVDKLVQYYEMSSMHGEDVSDFFPIDIPSAQDYLPIPETIQKPVSVYPIEESIPSYSSVDKKITIKRKPKKKPVSVYPIEESIPSYSSVDKKITIKRKPKKKPFSIDEYNFNKIVDNWNKSSILDDFKMYYPSEYKHIHDLFKMHVNKIWGDVNVTEGEGKKAITTKKQAIYPAQIAGWLSTKLITSLKKKYTPEKIYDGCYTLAYTLADEMDIIEDMDQIQDDGEDIEKYLIR